MQTSTWKSKKRKVLTTHSTGMVCCGEWKKRRSPSLCVDGRACDACVARGCQEERLAYRAVLLPRGCVELCSCLRREF
jgi:hypothetical protein